MLTPHIPQPKPPFPYKRPLSYSQLSSFIWSKERWYQSYVLGEKQPSSPELEFGSYVDKQIQKDPLYLPELKRCPHMQYKLETTFNGIQLLGFPDQLDLENPELRDTKTGRHPWTKKRADETGQLTMYLLIIYLTLKIKPEEFKCYIDWLPTCQKDGGICFVEPMKIKTFKTKRTTADILKFMQYIIDTRKEMEEYYNNHA